ncbi:hypothetical protein VB005_01698, partial [Metarhizium brunneum]
MAWPIAFIWSLDCLTDDQKTAFAEQIKHIGLQHELHSILQFQNEKTGLPPYMSEDLPYATSQAPGSCCATVITIASSPASVNSCDDFDNVEWNNHSDSDKPPSTPNHDNVSIDSNVSTSASSQQATGQKKPETTPLATPLAISRLGAPLSYYEKPCNEQVKLCQRRGSPDKVVESPSGPHEPKHEASYSNMKPAGKPRRGISKYGVQGRRYNTRSAASQSRRKKHALAPTFKPFEYLGLEDARQTSNGSVEVEVRRYKGTNEVECDVEKAIVHKEERENSYYTIPLQMFDVYISSTPSSALWLQPGPKDKPVKLLLARAESFPEVFTISKTQQMHIDPLVGRNGIVTEDNHSYSLHLHSSSNHYEVSVMLFWSMVLEGIAWAGLIAFERTYAQIVITRILQALLLTGIGLLLADFKFRSSSLILPTPAVAAFRMSMTLACLIMRFEGSMEKSQNWKYWIPLDIRICFEITAFGLSFLSFSDVLASRVQNGMFTVIGIVDGGIRLWRYRKLKETNRRQIAGSDTTDGVLLW